MYLIDSQIEGAMDFSLDQTRIEVWRQVLVENADAVVLGTERYRVRLTPKRRLREVDIPFDENKMRGLEHNPKTKSLWVQMARAGQENYAVPQLGPVSL